MDSMVLFMSMFGLFALLKSRQQTQFSPSWFKWLFTSTTFFAFGFCVKFVGLYTMAVGLIVLLYDFWCSLPNKSIPSVSYFFNK